MTKKELAKVIPLKCTHLH